MAHKKTARGWARSGFGFSKSGQGRARTGDTGLFRAVLYQLSYLTEGLNPFQRAE